MYSVDLKTFMKVDRKKLEECLKNPMKLGKLNSLKEFYMDIDEWEKFLNYSTDQSSLENFLLYRIAGEYNLYTEIDDADTTPYALNYLKDKLCSIDEVEAVQVGVLKQRAFTVTLKDSEVIYLESDTANSLMWDLGNFFRVIIPKVKKVPVNCWAEKTYIKEYNLLPAESDNYYRPFKLFYYLKLIPKLGEVLEDELEIKCLEELEKRASWIHTLDNMMLVPINYNSARGCWLKTYKSDILIKDRLDYTYMDLEEMIQDPKLDDPKIQERLKNEYCTRKSVDFLYEYKNILMPPCPQCDANNATNLLAVYKRCKSVNKIFVKKSGICGKI